jgi:hypothetical protein
MGYSNDTMPDTFTPDCAYSRVVTAGRLRPRRKDAEPTVRPQLMPIQMAESDAGCHSRVPTAPNKRTQLTR